MEKEIYYKKNQSSSIRRCQERKSCYRNLLDKIEEIEEKRDLSIQTATDVGIILKEINLLEEECCIEQKEDHTDETLLDCMVLSSTSNILVKCINAIDLSGTSYDSTDLCIKLCEQVEMEEQGFKSFDLLKILSEARTVMPDALPYVYVHGSYDSENLSTSKKKMPMNKNTKEKFMKAVPERVVTMDKDEKGIAEIVKGFYHVLMEEFKKNGEEAINYYDYVIDSSDFSSTVENMFYCSFLVRDGKARIDLVNNNPTIKPMTKKELSRFRSDNGLNGQMIAVITKEDWQSFNKEGVLQKYKALNKLD